MTLVGTGEIKTQHGLDRIQVHRLIAAGDWPDPVYELARGRLYDEQAVSEHVKALRKAGRLRKSGKGITIVPWKYLEASGLEAANS